jgi:presenilin-like A22 family membrane protease
VPIKAGSFDGKYLPIVFNSSLRSIGLAKYSSQPISIHFLSSLSIALAVKATITIAVIIIGLITFAFSYAGFYIGKSFGHFFETGIEALGGLILLALGTKILLEHLFFSNIIALAMNYNELS